MRLYPFAPASAATTRAYPSSLTDAEWAVVQPLIRRPAMPQGGRPPKHPLRQILDAIRYLVRTGCAWRLLPHDFPPPGTVYWWFAKWAADGTLARLHDALRERVRVAAGRRPAPSAAIIDSQSVRAADTVGKPSRGWDAGKKVNGRKRHLAVDTLGLLLVVLVTAASTQDRDAGRALLWRLRASYRGIRLVWADGGYAGRLVAWAAAVLHLVVEIVRKRPGQSTFEVLPRRWVVERTFAWISKHRRCVRDYERLPAHHAAMVTWAMIAVMTRRLARPHRPPPIQTTAA
ncbi:MAG TPA: IS5 family transposase [Actinomycetes bacterium]|jgi:transposase|nr:IS5 family transposase [Actinomycetes bacterium]